MKEIWKDIPNYKGYQASNLGRIRTYNKITYTKLHGERHWKNRILKFKPTAKNNRIKQGGGYRVSLWKNGKCKDFLVARIIAVGSLAGLTSVLLVMLMATTRILYAMSRDNFLPSIFRKLNRKTRTPNLLTYTIAFIAILGVLSMDLNAAAELCNYGAFTSFGDNCYANFNFKSYYLFIKHNTIQYFILYNN